MSLEPPVSLTFEYPRQLLTKANNRNPREGTPFEPLPTWERELVVENLEELEELVGAAGPR